VYDSGQTGGGDGVDNGAVDGRLGHPVDVGRRAGDRQQQQPQPAVSAHVGDSGEEASRLRVVEGIGQVLSEDDYQAAGVLAALADEPDLSQADLARIVSLRPQSMHHLITSLLERGPVQRAGPGGRGRRTRVELADTGRHALKARCPPSTPSTPPPPSASTQAPPPTSPGTCAPCEQPSPDGHRAGAALHAGPASNLDTPRAADDHCGQAA
jgi:hypothetical protein